MSFADWSNEKKKRERKEQEDTRAKNTQAVLGGNTSFSEWSNKKKVDSIDGSYIDTFINDANTFFNTAEDDYKGLGWGNASSTYEKRRSTWSDLDYRASLIDEWLYRNESRIGDDAYKSISEALENYRSGATSIMDGFKRSKDYYSQWDSEEDYNSWYEKNKSRIDLEDSATSASDFDEYSQKGASIENPTKNEAEGWFSIGNWLRVGAKDIGNIVTYSRENATEIFADEQEYGDTLGDPRYRQMTDNEVAIYNYYLAKFGEEKASEYLKSIDDLLDQREAGVIASNVDDNAFLEAIMGFGAGAESAVQGLKGLADYVTGNESGMDYSPTQYADQIVSSNNEGFLKGVHDVSTAIGGMFPSILVSTFTGNPILGAATMGGSAMGNGYNEMIELGYDEWQARGYGLLVGASEAVLQYALGGISKLGGKVTGKALGNLIAKFDNAIAKTAIKVGGNMLSEGTEEAIQTILEPAFKALMTGETFESPEWEEIWYSALLGALTAGVMEGAPTIAGTAISSHKAKSVYGANQNELVAEALEIDPDNAHAQRMKARLDGGKNVSGYQLNRLVEANESALHSQDTAKIKTAIQERLSQLGEKGDVSKLADSLVKQATGETLTKAERSAIKNSTYGQRVANELSPSNIESGEYSSAWAENIGTERINAQAYNKDGVIELYDLAVKKSINAEPPEDESVGKNPTEKENATEAKFEASTDGKTRIGDLEVSIKEVAAVKDGEVILRLEDGSTVNASDVEYGSSEEGLLYENVAHMNLNSATANAFVKGYDPSMSVEQYVLGFREAYRYGEYGFPMQEMSAKGFSAMLSESQKSLAYNLGKTDAKYKIDKKSAKIASISAKNAEKIASKGAKKGKLHNTIAPANERQRASLKALGALAEGLGIDIYTFESPVVNGKRQGANGWFDPKDGSIHIDIHAGASGEGTMLFTAAHELTHFIREWSPAKFKVFADFLLEQYGKKGVSVEELVQQQIEKAKNNGRDISYDTAYEEVIADSCEAMLADGDVIAKIADLKAKDKTLWQKIKGFLADLVERIKAVYKGMTPDSVEGRYVAEMLDSAERLKALWTEALVEASDAYSESEIVDINTESESVSPMFSERTWTASEYVTEREKTAKAISKALNVDINTAYKYIDDINGVARLIADDRARLDYEPNLDEKATVLKPNSEYKYTVDMSTLCAKRLLFTGTFDAIQKALPNMVFDSEDIVSLREMMQTRGYEVACGVCYVESTRREIGRITQDFIDSYKEAQKTGKPITRLNSEGKSVELKKTKEQKETTADKSTDKFYAEKGYTPTLADLNTTDIDLVKRDHPLVYEAYLNFMNARGQAKPKLLETRAEYKGEILKHFKSKSAVNSRNNAGGLRLQSFSDFEVPHMIDMMQIVMDMSRVGLKSQAYTKVPAFAEIFGDSGVKINLSLIAKGDGLDANGNLIFDDVEGINHKEAFKLRDKYSKNVGTILVGKTDAHIIAAMADPRIDYIIPFHKSSWKESLYDALGLTGYADYTDTQNEKPLDKDRKIKNFDPSEYWDFTKSGDENAQIYLEKCRKDGRIPKFPQFQGYPGYWKLLIDFKMYDNDGVGSPQEVVQPIFNTEASEIILGEYKGGHKSFPVAKDVVDDFVKEHKDKVKYSYRDHSYMDAVNRRDMETAQRMVDEVSLEAGYKNSFQVRQVLYSERSFASQVDAVLNGADTNSTHLKLMDTPSLLQEAGLPNLPILMTAKHLKTITATSGKGKGNYHGLDVAIVKKMPKYISSPVMIADSLTRDDSIVIITEAIDSENRPVVAAILLNGSGRVGGKHINANIMTSAYGKDNFQSFLNRIVDSDSVIYWDEKKSQDMSVSLGLQLPNAMTSLRSGVIIHQAKSFVNTKTENNLQSDRDTDSVSNRSLLANALESAAQNDIEIGKLKQYKEKIDLINSEQAKLTEIRAKIKELSFAKGARDTETIKNLQLEANKTANRINTYDKQLLNLESTTALKDVLEREKKMAYKRAEQKGKDALSAYRERATKTQRELMTRYQESRKKNVEGRKQTAMRHKIKDVVNELNQYLLKGTKDKHVPIELQKAVAEALDAVNMDTVGAEERLAKIHAELEKDPLNPKLLESYRRILEQGERMDGKLQALKNAYDEIVNSDDPLIANSHDEVISNSIKKVIKEVGDTPIRDMNLSQLEAVYDMYRMVLTSIRNANKTFKAEKGKEISVLANEIIAFLDGKKRNPLNPIDTQFAWNNLKPVYAFERIGSKTFTKLFNAVRAGEDVWAKDMSEAQAFREEQSKKYKYDSFDFEKKYAFETNRGNPFELTLGEMMSIYAYAKDEHSKGHLIGEGFVFDPKKEVVKKVKGKIETKVKLEDATAYNLSESIVEKINKTLSEIPGAKEFVDAMQDYLSATMGEKGNEVSLELYQVKLFKNKNYFPLKSAPQYMAVAKEQANGDVKIKNKGFTKDRKEGAKNPIVLSSFMDVWASHVNEMSMYHAFTLPLEDFYRVFNYRTPNMDGYAPMSVNGSLETAYGTAATSYIEQLLKDLNGGARVDSTAGIINKLTGVFKKSAVFASLSVVVQQPSAIARATALVDTKYFVGKPSGKHKNTWAEVKKYAPVAVIKEMGYFDTGMGQSSVEWLKGEKTWKDKVDDAVSKAPALADEYAWCAIWNAVKRETLHTHKNLKPNSEEFLNAVGERFTEVITKTQVYDSVLSRSAYMRSKDSGVKMATAFMGEPTTSINMIQDALTQGKRGNKRYARKAIGGVVSSMILNSILVSLVYAGRDDDEEKTYAEKYIGTLTEELLDSLNPLTLIPFVKDIVSIVQGYDVERSDMAVVTDLINAWNNLDSDNRSVYRKVEDFAGAIASIFGLPVKNIMRDARGMYNTVNSFINGEKTTGAGIGVALTEAVTGDAKSNGQQLYDAMVNGDTAQIQRVKSRFKNQSAIDTAIRKALRENDSRIKQAAEARYNGDVAGYMRIAKEIIAEGNFSQDNIVAAINSEINVLKKGDGTSESTTSNKVESIYKMDDYYMALKGRDQASAYAVKEDLIKTDVANGKDRDEAEADFNSKFASHLREMYEDGEISDYEAQNMLVSYGGKSSEDAYSKVQYWAFKKEYPDYDLSEEAVNKYYSDVEPSGIRVAVYYDYTKQRAKCKGTDSNGDGKTDSGSVKAEVLEVINSLPITYEQKDVLYYLNGWSASTIWEAPWH